MSGRDPGSPRPVGRTSSGPSSARLLESEAKFTPSQCDRPVVWSTRPDGVHDYYNERWYEYTGVPPGSTDGEAWNGVFQRRTASARGACGGRARDGRDYHIEYRLRTQRRISLGHGAGPMRPRRGRNISRWFGTCTDIHDLKTDEEQVGAITHLLQPIQNTPFGFCRRFRFAWPR